MPRGCDKHGSAEPNPVISSVSAKGCDLHQMIPTAGCAHLDNVGSKTSLASIQTGQFAFRRDTPPVSRQARPEDIGHMGQMIRLADRTYLPGPGSTLERVPPQHGLSVTKSLPGEVSPTPRVESGLAG